MNASASADVLVEAFEQYLGWDVYQHGTAPERTWI